jgi:hypothetical protein
MQSTEAPEAMHEIRPVFDDAAAAGKQNQTCLADE